MGCCTSRESEAKPEKDGPPRPVEARAAEVTEAGDESDIERTETRMAIHEIEESARESLKEKEQAKREEAAAGEFASMLG